jgi:tetratricopeptide (TPR) repeat protein
MNQKDDDALAEFSEAIRLDGGIAMYYRDRGNAYIAKGDYDKAIADFDQAIKRAPESPSGYKGRAQSYFKKGITGLARDDYNKALSLNPDADSRKQIEEALKELGPDVRNMKMQ